MPIAVFYPILFLFFPHFYKHTKFEGLDGFVSKRANSDSTTGKEVHCDEASLFKPNSYFPVSGFVR